MDYEVTWTDPAREDLREIIDYIANDNPDAAERVGNDILDHTETLGTFPFIGPTYPRGSRSKCREIVCGKYRIFYRVSERKKLVEILAVWHGARGTPNLG